MTAFRQSVEAMIPALRRYARALARDADIADDLVQDTLVRALRSERLLGGDVRTPAAPRRRAATSRVRYRRWWRSSARCSCW
jgi:DNA-directed RNA polymerase specialized sigma24 family protein